MSWGALPFEAASLLLCGLVSGGEKEKEEERKTIVFKCCFICDSQITPLAFKVYFGGKFSILNSNWLRHFIGANIESQLVSTTGHKSQLGIRVFGIRCK